MSQVSLFERRCEIAEHFYQNYDFDAIAEDCSGWEGAIPGLELTRAVFLENDDRAKPSVRVHLVVRFKDRLSAEVEETYAIDEHGHIFGHYVSSLAA